MHQPDFEEVFGLNAAYAEKVYGDYLDAPESVPAEWRTWFETELPPEQRAAIKPPVAAPQVAGEIDDELSALTGVAGKIVKNMVDSLSVPTATSTREVPVKVLEENRHSINRHQLGQYLFVVVIKDGLFVCPVSVLVDPLAIAVPERVCAPFGRRTHNPDASVQAPHGPGQERDHGTRLAHARRTQDDETTLRLRVDATRLGEFEVDVLHVLHFFNAFKSCKARSC